jgi:hypothetical protein
MQGYAHVARMGRVARCSRLEPSSDRSSSPHAAPAAPKADRLTRRVPPASCDRPTIRITDRRRSLQAAVLALHARASSACRRVVPRGAVAHARASCWCRRRARCSKARWLPQVLAGASRRGVRCESPRVHAEQDSPDARNACVVQRVNARLAADAASSADAGACWAKSQLWRARVLTAQKRLLQCAHAWRPASLTRRSPCAPEGPAAASEAATSEPGACSRQVEDSRRSLHALLANCADELAEARAAGDAREAAYLREQAARSQRLQKCVEERDASWCATCFSSLVRLMTLLLDRYSLPTPPASRFAARSARTNAALEESRARLTGLNAPEASPLLSRRRSVWCSQLCCALLPHCSRPCCPSCACSSRRARLRTRRRCALSCSVLQSTKALIAPHTPPVVLPLGVDADRPDA